MFKEYMDTRRTNCILCPERVINIIQFVYKNYFSRCRTFKVKISQTMCIDIRTEVEQDTLIDNTHETSHHGI